MAIHALDFMAKVSSRFVHEILPVATASVIGAMLVNHYGRQPASPSIVIQAAPSASEDAMVQSLREEHELIASFMKRNQETANDAERPGSAATQVASLAPPPLFARGSAVARATTGGAKSGGEARAKADGQEKARVDGGAGASAGPSCGRVRDPSANGLLAAAGSN